MKLFKHQQTLLDTSPDKHLLSWGCGTGKTLASLKLAETKTKNILVICPKSLTTQWREQCDYTVMSKEEFKRDSAKLPRYDCILLDEAHFFAGMQGLKKKSQLLKSLLGYIKEHDPKHIYALTATPYMSSPWNIYALAEILGHKLNYQAFKQMFFQEVNMGLRWPVPVVRKGIEKQIAQIVNRIGSTVKMEDCFDVPEQIFQTEYFDLTKEQKKAIDSLEDTAAIVRWTKVHQICGGTLKGNGYEETKHFKSEKVDRLLELINEHPLIAVVCRYNAEIDCLYDKIKNQKTIKISSIHRITGRTDNRHEVIEAVNGSSEAIILINSACSEGYGIASVPIMVFYSYDFSLKNYIQMCGRIQRANNIKKNVYLSLIVKKTIDEDVFKSIQQKENFQVEIYNK